MKRAPVDSSSIASVGYDPDEQILEIEFLTGGVYRYFDVEPSVYEDFMRSDSLGRYFAANIRENYDFQLLT